MTQKGLILPINVRFERNQQMNRLNLSKSSDYRHHDIQEDNRHFTS